MPGKIPHVPRFNVPETFGKALSYEGQIHAVLQRYDDTAKEMNDALPDVVQATEDATTAADTATDAATAANNAAGNAIAATATANFAAQSANTAAQSANTAASRATAATSLAETATTNANNATTAANTATTNANAAATRANNAAASIEQFYPADNSVTTAKIVDGAVTNAKLDQVGGILSDVNAMLDGRQYIRANFVIGLLDTTIGGTGAINTAFTNRVSTDETIVYDRDITLTVDTGYRGNIALIDANGIVTANFVLLPGNEYTIFSGQRFRVMIQKDPLATVTSIDECIEKMTFGTYDRVNVDKANRSISFLSDAAMPIEAEWQRGYVVGGNYSNVNYAVRTVNCVKFDSDTMLRCDEPGYMFQLFEFSDIMPSSSTYIGYSGNLRGCYMVPKDTYHVIVILQDPTDTSITADIATFTSKLHIVPQIALKMNECNDFWHMPAFGNTRKKLVGHKGIISTYPENTTASFEEAGSHGLFGIETDIQVTSDGYLVCMHDDTVDRTTDGTGAVISKTLAQIRALHIDGDTTGLLKVPTVEEYLSICKRYGCVAIMELKTAGGINSAVKTLVDAIVTYGMQNQSVIICSQYSIGRVQTLTMGIPCMFNAYDNDYQTVVEMTGRYTNMMFAHGVQDGNTLTDAKIAEIHALGMPVCAFVVNDATAADSLFGRGVDLVVTDYLTE